MPDSGDPTTSGATYAEGPAPGDPVVFDVEVANYSLAALTEPLTVDFYAVPVDENFLDSTGDAVEIGSTTVTGIAAQSRVTVSSPEWAAQGSQAGGGQNWRIFVVLDADGGVDEIHEWAGTDATACPTPSVQDEETLVDPMTEEPERLACGQNNQGFGQLSVVPREVPDGAQARVAATIDPANVILIGAGVLTDDPGTLRLTLSSEIPQVTTGSPTTVLLRAGADRNSARHQTVIVYDGPPEEGNIVAVTRMLGVFDTGLSTASFTYTPTADGPQELHAVLLGGVDVGESRGLIVRLNAVADADDGGNGGGGDGGGGSDGGDRDGDLATTGQNALPWLFVGIGALMLIAIGVVLWVARSRRG